MVAQRNIKAKYIFKATLFCIVFTAFIVVFSIAKGFIPIYFERLAHGIIGTIAALLTTILFLKFDKKQFSDIGLTFERRTIIKFLAGIVAGVAIMGILAISVLYFSNTTIQVNSRGSVGYFLLMTLPLILLSFMEELGFRAYPLEILKDKVGIRLSIIITSILFALYHIANGWTISGSFYGPGIWGLLFGLAAVYSKGIAMPTGMHYAANLTTATFGAADNNLSIWIVEQSHSHTEKVKGINWSTILPGLAILILAIIGIEMYMRRKTAANMGFATWRPTNKTDRR